MYNIYIYLRLDKLLIVLGIDPVRLFRGNNL